MSIIKNIDQEIESLLKIKKEVDYILELKRSVPNILVVSQARYDFFASKNLLRPEIFYYIASTEVRPYIEDFQG